MAKLGSAKNELLQQSITAFDRAIRLEPHRAGTYYRRSLCHAWLGNEEAARTDLRQALQRDVDGDLIRSVAARSMDLILENHTLRQRIDAEECDGARDSQEHLPATKGDKDPAEGVDNSDEPGARTSLPEREKKLRAIRAQIDKLQTAMDEVRAANVP